MIIKFKYKKDTPGTYVYEQVDANNNAIASGEAIIPTLYIRKVAFGEKHPEFLTIELQ